MQSKYFVEQVLEANLDNDRLLQFCAVEDARLDGTDAVFTVTLCERSGGRTLRKQPANVRGTLRVRCYGDQVIRLRLALDNAPFANESPMLEWDPALQPVQVALNRHGDTYTLTTNGQMRFSVGRGSFAPVLVPDGCTRVQVQDQDHFEESLRDALPGLVVQRGDGTISTGFAVQIAPDEHFCGTGERFDRLDLYGRRIDLVNDDARGVNNSRAYKNVPFCMSSRGYGLFVHSTAKMRLDIGAHSHRSLQWILNDTAIDLFCVGGRGLGDVLRNYQRITGSPRMPSLWSFGTWMSRMTYLSDEQVTGIAQRLRDEQYPMDVLHLDTGWFAEDWKCDWRFSDTSFPNPPDFFQRMLDQGFHVSLWQYPYINRDVSLSETAFANHYIGQPTTETPDVVGGDSVGSQTWGDTLDFTNPAATEWYKDLLRGVLKQGAAAIKADFGENINEQAIYRAIDPQMYRNLYALLYQRAVWDVTEEVNGNRIIWARSSWAGSQRYPVHWGGDAACSFDALATSIWGGLQLGLSGFAFWSHDVGGFHGVPDFMNDKPSEQLYLRWTQVGVFTSHMRYHGTTPREPWEYPGVADAVRQWLRLRYALLPYILAESEKCCANGRPMLRALPLEWNDDPVVWSIQDEYLFGDAFLVCPVLNAQDTRDIYLPEGDWVDFWTGEAITGPAWRRGVHVPLDHMPIYVRRGARVPFAEPVQHTGELDGARRFEITFDETYTGLDASELGRYITL
jgi:alpha-D-xyloside xylohydrolase